MQVDDQDMDTLRRALDSYVTYQAMIEKTGIRESLDRAVASEFLGEDFTPPLSDLVIGL